MARFVVKDLYDFDETLIETNDLNEAYAAALRRYADTDGECDVHLYDNETAPFLTSPSGEYMCVEFWGEEED